MTVTLYNTSDPDNKLSKNTNPITGGSDITAIPTQGVSVLAPSLSLDYSSDYLGANYLYISDFSRYYYIRDMKVDIGKKIYLYCEVDPLMSFSSQISNCPITATRNEGIGAPTKIPDNKLPVIPNVVDVKSTIASDVIFSDAEIDQGIELYNYVLIVLNGGASI